MKKRVPLVYFGVYVSAPIPRGDNHSNSAFRLWDTNDIVSQKNEVHFMQNLTFLSLDRRSLSAFRVLLGLFLLLDALTRLSSVEMLYTDSGVLPRVDLILNAWEPWYAYFSLHTQSGGIFFQSAALLGQAGLALCVMLGVGTRLALWLLWFLLTSLLVRNPMVVNGGDKMILNVILWASFLPLSDYFTWKVRLGFLKKKEKQSEALENQVANLATVAFMLQLVFVYFGSALEKSGYTWSEGIALFYSLHLDFYQKPFAEVLTDFPQLCKILTYFTFILEKYLVFLILMPWRNGFFRLLIVVLYWGLHFSIFLTLEVGMFSWFAMAAWAALLPSWVWDRFFPRLLPAKGWEVLLFPHKFRVFFKALNLTFLCALLLLTTAAFVARHSTLTLPPWTATSTGALHLGQAWGMFAPDAPKKGGWFVLEATFAAGDTLNLYTGEAITTEKPARFSAYFPNHRERKLAKNLTKSKNKKFVPLYLAYFARNYESRQGRKPKKLRLLFYEQRILYNGGYGAPNLRVLGSFLPK
jgi:hypothetical protein